MRTLRWACVLVLLLGSTTSAQSWTAPRTWSTGELVNASLLNAQIRDNELVLRAGGFAVSSQAVGDLLCASSTTQFARLAGVASGQVLASAGTSTCPAYTAVLNLSGAGTHTISGGTSTSQILAVTNTSSGTTARSYLNINAGTNGGYLQVLSQGWTSANDLQQSGVSLEVIGAGGLSLASINASGGVNIYTGSTPSLRATFFPSGGVSVGNTEDGGVSSLYVGSNSATHNIQIVAVSASNSISVREKTNGTGAVGQSISIGNNTSGSGAAGYLGLSTRSSGIGYLWVDGSGTPGVVRISGSSPPVEDGGSTSDTSGTIVGTQTSTRDTKDLLWTFTDYRGALDAILRVPIYRFTYKGRSYNGTVFTGIVADEFPEVMMDPDAAHPEGRSFSPVSAAGYTFAAIRALQIEIDNLKNPYARLFR